MINQAALLLTVAFGCAALVWSGFRAATAGQARWRLAHGMATLSLVAGGWALWAGRPGFQLLAGLVLILVALAILLGDRRRGVWLALVQVLLGIVLASGLGMA